MEKLKTKVRFTSLDVTAMTCELQQMIGCRVSNIYDINPSTYIFKFAKSEQKYHLLVENGVRFHPTETRPEKDSLPSGFTMKFRKLLRSKRLERVKQVGIERVVVFTFGTEAFCNHLILELYAQGNIVLTDSNFRIVQCMRSHQFSQEIKTAIGEVYPFEQAANLYIENLDPSPEAALKLLSQGEVVGETKGKKKGGGVKLKDIVQKMMPSLYPLAIQHILLEEGIDGELAVDASSTEIVAKGAKACLVFLNDFQKIKHKGYLGCRPVKQGTPVQYFQFGAFKYLKYDKLDWIELPSFGAAAEEYFSKYKRSQHEDEENFQQITWKKYEQIRKDQIDRMSRLQEQQHAFRIKAQYVQKNADEIEAVLKIVKTMESNGYSWEDIERMIAEAKKNGDPLANMVHGLDIKRREITLLLGDPSVQEQLCPLLRVEVSVDCNAYTNATNYYDAVRRQAQKENRTRQACDEVLQGAEKEAKQKIEKKKAENIVKQLAPRKQLWFQKFYWFITSEGFLVLSGRDSHQNELLVKRYMKSGDLYMHSDYGGAASTVIKRPVKAQPVPRMSLEEAAVFTVCRSKAWDTKILSGAWWVYDEQVSKSAPTGQFLPTGSFMIRGKRNYLQPTRMEMGLTLLFQIDAQSALRHIADRKIHEDFLFEESTDKETESNEDDFAIVSFEQQVKANKQKPKGKQASQQASQQVSQQVSQPQKKEEVDVVVESDDSEDSYKDKKGLMKKKSQDKKSQDKKSQQKKGQETKPRLQETKVKHKNRNEKKLKKLARYLQEQDEEERVVIMKMLGAKQMKHLQQPQPVPARGKKGIDKYIDRQEQVKPVIDVEKVLFLQTEVPLKSKSKFIAMLEQDKLDRKEEQDQQEENNDSEEEAVQEEVIQVPKQKEEEIDDKQIESELGELSRLVGRVGEEDNVEHLIVMCAPYMSVKDNRYRVKLAPGGMKKGKAARAIVHYLQEEATEKEKALIKTVPEQEYINAIIGNVKLAGAGLLKLELKGKAEKKEQKKEAERKDSKKQ